MPYVTVKLDKPIFFLWLISTEQNIYGLHLSQLPWHLEYFLFFGKLVLMHSGAALETGRNKQQKKK